MQKSIKTIECFVAGRDEIDIEDISKQKWSQNAKKKK